MYPLDVGYASIRIVLKLPQSQYLPGRLNNQQQNSTLNAKEESGKKVPKQRYSIFT
ncbi:hypothetical protein Pint_18413 [Pistacia integerrima]|uniref:Uncharacterized protein n=1 Tax=Pistacia integerrima TaxID=434235 RepID=A0ACC0YUL9_9ROSI|nr:hypothetical protein Pint_18413 [Pistacia integerrima]